MKFKGNPFIALDELRSALYYFKGIRKKIKETIYLNKTKIMEQFIKPYHKYIIYLREESID